MDKIRVLHIITRLDPGGSSTNTIETVSRLNGKVYDPFLLSGQTKDSDGSIELQLRQKGIAYKFLPHLQREISPLNDIKAFIELFRFIADGHFDIVHTHSSKAGILGRWAAKSAGVRYIVHTPHGHIFYGYFGRLKTALFIWIERLTALITDKIITLTHRGKQEHLDFKIAPAAKFIPIYSGIAISDTAFFHSQDQKEQFKTEWEIPERSFIFGTVARLDPIKGISFLIRATKQVVTKYPHCQLLIVGEGEEKIGLLKQTKDSGLENHIIFTGFQKETRPFIECMDVFVLASLNEGQGRVLLEALDCEKPVIATRVGGIPELIEEGRNGLLVPPKDSSALESAMLNFLQYPALAQKMGKEGKQMVGDKFTLDQMVRDIENLYAGLIHS